MKIIVQNYTFDASAQTLEFDDYATIALENVLAVINVTDGIVIFASNTPAKGGSVATNVLTLEHDTTSMSDTDDLQIFYFDVDAETAINDGGNSITVDGTFWQATQPISAATLPLPSGAGTSSKQDTIIGHLDGVETTLTAIDGRVDDVEGLLTTIDADTSNLSTKIDTLAGAVAGTEMQVDVLTMPTVTVTATNLDVQSGGVDLATSAQAAAIQTAVEIIDNAISGNEMQVDVLTMPTVTVNAHGITGTVAVTQSGTWDEVGINDSGNSITVDQATGSNLHAVVDSGTITTVSTVTSVTAIANALPAGTNNIGDVDVLSLPAIPAGSNNIGAVSLGPNTAGGLSTFHLASAGSTNATNIKATPGQVFGWYIYNSNAAARKVVFHNTAGTPTAGASVLFSLMIPPTSGANVEMTNGIVFGTGIGITTVTGLADSDTAAVAANDLIINIFYK